jgi:hypothetical protein
MHEVTLSPQAAAGLFFSHRNHEVKGVANTRASCDAERFFLDEADPLIKSEVVDVPKTAENPAGKATATGASFREARVLRLEKHVYEWLKAAHAAVVEAGSVYGRRPGQVLPEFSEAASAALEAAREVQAEKAAPPKILEPKAKRA